MKALINTAIIKYMRKFVVLLVFLASCSYLPVKKFSFPFFSYFTTSSAEKISFSQPATYSTMVSAATLYPLKQTEGVEEEVIYPDEEQLTTEEGINVELPEVKLNVPLPFPYPVTKVSFDFPVTYNTQVENWIKFFTGKGRIHFAEWLSRMYLYIDYVKREFIKNNLPSDLAYLPLIESGFNVRARSPAWAIGMWQFMAYTGRKYGLKINYWIDERRDPWKSTEAAIKYLKELHKTFGDWNLAIAAYNAGEGKIKKAIRRYGSRDFWVVKKHRYIRRETANYVPKFIAALIIAKCPECFGFHLTKDTPLKVDRVKLPYPVDLYLVSEITDVPLDKLLFYNPELRHWVTPPDYKGYELKLPAGKGEAFLLKLKNFSKKVIAKRYLKYRKYVRERIFIRHRMRWGETLSHVARRYHVYVRTLMRINHIRNPRRVRAGHRILIPVVRGRTLAYYTSGKYYAPVSKRSKISSRHNRGIRYRVKPGDTLWSIARRFGVTVSQLKSWNRIRGNFIRDGRILYVRKYHRYYSRYRKGKIKYIVREGDTLWDISRKFGVPINRIKTVKKKYQGRNLYPGDVLIIEKD